MSNTMKYADVVNQVCGDNWNSASQGEREGGFGVAIVISHLKGNNSSIYDLSKDLRVPISDLEVPYNRLQLNGVFSKRSSFLKDNYLTGNYQENQENNAKAHRAWCHIAAIAGGFLGKGSGSKEFNI